MYNPLIYALKGFGVLLLVVVTFSCVDPYWPELDSKYDEALVVDGKITNMPPPYTVRLSISSPVSHPEFKPKTACKVSVVSSLGELEHLDEIEPGLYRSAIDGMQGEIGIQYKLRISTADEKLYESEFERLTAPTPIDSIYTQVEYTPHPQYERDMQGLRFYVDTKEAIGDTNYYRWELERTFKYHANYLIKYIFDGQMHPFSPTDSLYTCYRTDYIHESFTYNTSDLTIPIVKAFPLHFVSTETKELSIRYSLLLNQYSLSASAFNYWSKVKSMIEEQGALYTRQPFQIRSNVFNVSDAEEPVMGYFMVAGQSQKRMYFDRPMELEYFYPDSCNLYPVDINILWIKREQWPLLLPAFFGGTSQQPAWVDYQWCVDCRALGGGLNKPDFWVD